MTTTVAELASSACSTVDDCGSLDHDTRKEWLLNLQDSFINASDKEKKDAIRTITSDYAMFRYKHGLHDVADTSGTAFLRTQMSIKLGVHYP